MKIKVIAGIIGTVLSFMTVAGEVAATSVTARQRYPWNGLVDVVVTLNCESNDLINTVCSFVATNSATGKPVSVAHIAQKGVDVGSDTVWTRRFVWNAANDVGTVKIDDLVLVVDARALGSVQLWDGGPCWAECNIGALKPEEYGYYFWWGDTVGYEHNAVKDRWFPVTNGASFLFVGDRYACPTLDAQLRSAEYVDSSGNLVAAHDAATAHLGKPWRMPTAAEIEALVNNCTTTDTFCNGAWGLLVTGKGEYSTKSIFLPAGGYGNQDRLDYDNAYGKYWSATSCSDGSKDAYYLRFSSEYFTRGSFSPHIGMPVRPVRDGGFARKGTSISPGGVTTRLKLDCREGLREPAVGGEELRYDASWCEGGSEVRIKENGSVIATGTAGEYTWHIGRSDSCRTLTLEILSDGQIIGTEKAHFGFGYVRNVKARQLWPHNKIALEFTVADDIGEVKRESDNLFVWCGGSVLTNMATRISGDRSAKPGVHRIVWDVEGDGNKYVSQRMTFGISVISTGAVQLWEDGPYWAECNVGASAPEDCGYYFWWGDTVGYKLNANDDGFVSVKDESAFVFDVGNCPTYYKSASALAARGYLDSTGNLKAAHDAATAHLGKAWRMPTAEEMNALNCNCTMTQVSRSGVCGVLVTGKGAYSNKSIFFPSVGYGAYSGCTSWQVGCYWSSTGSSDSTTSVSWFGRQGTMSREYGLPVRPVRGLAEAETDVAKVGTVTVDVIVTDMTLRDGMPVAGSATLGYAPVDQRAAELQINGLRVLSSTHAGEFVWCPSELGEHAITHVVGANAWTRIVNVESVSAGVEKYGKLGYEFVGWFGNLDEVGSCVYHDQTSRISPDGSGETQYALWLPNAYTIRFAANGGAGEMLDLACRYDRELVLPMNEYLRDGYLFEGWSTVASGAVVFHEKAMVSNLTAIANGVVTLHAVWKAVGCDDTTSDHFPDMGEKPTAAEVAAVVAGAADARLVANVDADNYASFRAWAETVKAADGETPAGAQGVLAAATAWESYALDLGALLAEPLAEEDVAIAAFEPAAEAGKFEVTVAIADVEVGPAATAENLKRVLGLEGAATLEGSGFSADQVVLEAGEPVDGKVKFTVRPTDAKAEAFFLKVKLQP